MDCEPSRLILAQVERTRLYYKSVLRKVDVADSNHANAKAYEMACALISGLLVWEDMTAQTRAHFRECGVSNLNDYGADLIDMDASQVGQCKLVAASSAITWRQLGTFNTIRDDMGVPHERAHFYVTPDARFLPRVQTFVEKKNMPVHRASLEDLLERLDLGTPATPVQNFQIEEREIMILTKDKVAQQDKVLLSAPCGTGKTYVFVYCFETLFRDGTMLVVVNSTELRTQSVTLLENRGFRVQVVKGDKPIDRDAQVHVVTYQWLCQHKFEIPVTLMVLDECHHIARNNKWREGTEQVKAQKRLYLTATPHHSQTPDVEMTWEEALAKGYICDYVLHCLYVNRGTVTTPCVCAKLAEEATAWGPTLLYWNTTRSAAEAAERLEALGLRAVCLTGQTEARVRERAIDDFRAGRVQVLSLCGVLNEGVSIDEVHTIVFGDTRQSATNIQQIAFRGTRRHPTKSHFRIVIFAGEDDFDRNTQIGIFLNKLAERDGRLYDSIRRRDDTHFRLRAVGPQGAVSEDACECDVVRERVLKRVDLVVYDKGRQTFEVLGKILRRNEVPKSNRKYCFDGKDQGKFRDSFELTDNEFDCGTLFYNISNGTSRFTSQAEAMWPDAFARHRAERRLRLDQRRQAKLKRAQTFEVSIRVITQTGKLPDWNSLYDHNGNLIRKIKWKQKNGKRISLSKMFTESQKNGEFFCYFIVQLPNDPELKTLKDKFPELMNGKKSSTYYARTLRQKTRKRNLENISTEEVPNVDE